MTPDTLAELALASERLVFPATVGSLTDPQVTAKTLLVLGEAGWQRATAPSALRLEPIDGPREWTDYTSHRVEVERAFGIGMAQAADMVETVRDRVTKLDLRMFFAVLAGERVGAVGWFPVAAGERSGVRLQEIDIFPGHQGKGHGNAMMGAVTDRLRAEGTRTIIVGADEDDWPLGWYRRHGFEDVCRVPLTR